MGTVSNDGGELERRDGFSYLLSTFLAYQSLTVAARTKGKRLLGGSLVLLAEESSSATIRATAARIAGAASLLVCPDEQRAKQVVRSGACDFLVSGSAATGLDEALRILKTELRRGAAVGVCLHAEPAAILRACVERGVQPDFFDFPEPSLVARGSTIIDWSTTLSDDETATLCQLATGPLSLMATLDKSATDVVAEKDTIRQRWLEQAPAVLGRAWQRFRLLPLREDEARSFLLKVQNTAEATSVDVRIEENPFGTRTRLVYLRQVS